MAYSAKDMRLIDQASLHDGTYFHNREVGIIETEARNLSTDYLHGYINRHDAVGPIRRGLRALGRVIAFAGNPRIEAYRNVLKTRESSAFT